MPRHHTLPPVVQYLESGTMFREPLGFTDLTLGDSVQAVLEAHMEASPDRFRGIRHATSWHASPDIRNAHTGAPAGLMADAEFQTRLHCLHALGLSFDAWLYHTQFMELVDLARACPEGTIVLDHVGGPLGIGPYRGKRDGVFAEWQNGIMEPGACPNVLVKPGNMAMPMSGFGWHKQAVPPTSAQIAEALAPYYLHCIEQFGADRCMFESNFPVDEVSCSYAVLWNVFKRIVQDFCALSGSISIHDCRGTRAPTAVVRGGVV